jgi:universal stress protein A
MIPIKSILAAVDFSDESLEAAKLAVSLAQEYKAELHLIHVYAPEPPYALSKEFLEETMKELNEKLSSVISEEIRESVPGDVILEKGHPVHNTIVQEAKELGVDLIVVGTRGRTGLSHVLLGSVAEHVIRYAPCPVFVIRNPREKYLYEWE